MVLPQFSKLAKRVRFPLPALEQELNKIETINLSKTTNVHTYLSRWQRRAGSIWTI